MKSTQDHSMLQDYAEGLHFGLVEQGGFLRYSVGLEPDHWRALQTAERANIAARNALGTEACLQLIRRWTRISPADDTGGTSSSGETEEKTESESLSDDAVNEEPQTKEITMMTLVEQLKARRESCVNRGLIRASMRLQQIILQLLVDIRGGVSDEMVERKPTEGSIS